MAAVVGNAVREFRSRAGLTQERLARRCGVSRQALNAVEMGHSVPSTAVALQLSRALGLPLEELFWLDETAPVIRAELSPDAQGKRSERVALADVAGRWIAHPLPPGEAALGVAADGLLRAAARRIGPRREARVQPLRPLPALRANLLAAGCDPALGLLSARLAERFTSARLVWLDAPSEPALEALARGHAHLAGSHLLDEATGEFNVPFVRALFAGRRMLVVTLAGWEEGFAVAPGNPLRIRRAQDLARPGVRIVNRAPSAGARRLLDGALRRAGLAPASVRGYDRVVRGHLDVARSVASGAADAGVVPRGVAQAQGLGFVPLSQERFDLVLPVESAADERVARALDVLRSRAFRRELSTLGGYDATRAGQVAAEVGP